MSTSGNSRDSEAAQPMVVGEVEPFDPGPSVRAAAAALGRHGVDFALIGGLALDAWGIPRATKDAARRRNGGPSAAHRRDGRRDQEQGLRVDLVDRRFHFAPLFQEAIDEAVASGRKARVGGTDVSLVSLEFLLAMKLVSGEPKDEIDARRILQREELHYLDARAIVERHLGPASANRLDAMAREAGRPEVVRRLYRNGEEAE